MSDSNRGLGERWPILLVFVYEQQLALGWPLGGFLSSHGQPLKDFEREEKLLADCSLTASKKILGGKRLYN